METEGIYFLLLLTLVGSLSLWTYLSFQRGADRPSQRGVARFAIKSGMRHLPVMSLAGAAFWYSIVLTILAAYLPEGVRTVPVVAGFLLIVTAVVLMVVWAYRPPRRLLPQWYLAELDQAPKPRGTERSRALTAVMIWLAALSISAAYASYRLDAPWFLWSAAAVAGAAMFVGYVIRN